MDEKTGCETDSETFWRSDGSQRTVRWTHLNELEASDYRIWEESWKDSRNLLQEQLQVFTCFKSVSWCAQVLSTCTHTIPKPLWVMPCRFFINCVESLDVLSIWIYSVNNETEWIFSFGSGFFLFNNFCFAFFGDRIYVDRGEMSILWRWISERPLVRPGATILLHFWEFASVGFSLAQKQSNMSW